MNNDELIKKAIKIQYEQGNTKADSIAEALDFVRGNMSDKDLDELIKSELSILKQNEKPKYTLTDNQRDEIKGVILQNEKQRGVLYHFPLVKKLLKKDKENISPERLVHIVQKLGYKKEALQQALHDPAVSKTKTAKTIKHKFPGLGAGRRKHRRTRRRAFRKEFR